MFVSVKKMMKPAIFGLAGAMMTVSVMPATAGERVLVSAK